MLFYTLMDIMQYLDTKAVAKLWWNVCWKPPAYRWRDWSHCYLSGAFPAHSDLESAITVRIFPDLPGEIFKVHTNTSLDGAKVLILDRSRLEDIRHLSEDIYCMQFDSIPDFMIRMQAAKFIPCTDLNRIPSVCDRLEKT